MIKELTIGIAGRYAIELAVLPTLEKISQGDAKLIRTLRYNLGLRTISKEVRDYEAQRAERDDGLQGFDALNEATDTDKTYTCEEAPLDKLREWLKAYDGAKSRDRFGQAVPALMDTIADLSDAVTAALDTKPTQPKELHREEKDAGHK